MSTLSALTPLRKTYS